MQFFKATTAAQAQNRADALRYAAKLLGISVPSHAAAQQLIAKENGHATWAALKASQNDAVDALLLEVELAHANVSLDEGGVPPRYDGEMRVAMANGFGLCFDVEKSGDLAHARVTDPTGRELYYLCADEIEESPLEVIRALLVCAGRLHHGSSGAARARPATVRPPMGAQLSTLSAVVVNDEYYHVQYSGPDVTDPTGVVLFLTREDDGRMFEIEVELETLQNMRWNAEKAEFEAPDGDTYVFYRNTPVTFRS